MIIGRYITDNGDYHQSVKQREITVSNTKKLTCTSSVWSRGTGAISTGIATGAGAISSGDIDPRAIAARGSGKILRIINGTTDDAIE